MRKLLVALPFVLTFSWVAAVQAQEAPRLLVDSATLAGGSSELRLVVGDGIHEAEARSEPIELPDRAPIASIISPPDGYQRPAGRLIELRGSAIDPEDQATTIRWTSDRDGELGTGTASGVTNLSEGTHRITMIAVDTAGNRSEQSVEVIAGSTDLSRPELTDEVADLLTRGISTTDRDDNRRTSRDWPRIGLIAALTISIGLSALVVRDRRTARTSSAAPTPDTPEVE